MSIERQYAGTVYHAASFEGKMPELTRGLELADTADRLWTDLVMRASRRETTHEGLAITSKDDEIIIRGGTSPYDLREFGMKQLGGVWRLEERVRMPGKEYEGDASVIQITKTYSTDPRERVRREQVVGIIGWDKSLDPVSDPDITVTDMSDEIAGRLIRQMQEFMGENPARDEAASQAEVRGVKGTRWLGWLFRK